jgi:outer membrane protein OmpA-like peptidoglycan-associated protein
MFNTQFSVNVENCSLSIAFFLFSLLLFPVLLPAQSLRLVNSPADELAPVFSPGGDSLFFVRDGHAANRGGQDAWLSVRLPNGSWDTPRPLPRPLNNAQENAIAGLSRDGTLWLTNAYRGRRMRPGVSVARFDSRKNAWQTPRPVPVPGLDSVRGTLGFHVVGDSVLLISMATGGAETEDLFVSRKTSEGTWTVPVSLGPVLNSDGYEIAPFYSGTDSTLYFASDGHGGFGDGDVFRSRRLDTSWTRWSVPENLGPRVNTAAFEAYFTLNPKDGRGYFVRSEDEAGDLHTVRLDAAAADSGTRRPAPETARVPATAPEPSAAQVPESVMLFFAFESAQLPDSAMAPLERVAEIITQSTMLRLELIGYADAVGETGNNFTLAGQRAEAVRQFLRARGVRSDRMRTRIEGETKARSNERASEAARQPDRRVEIRFTTD